MLFDVSFFQYRRHSHSEQGWGPSFRNTVSSLVPRVSSSFRAKEQQGPGPPRGHLRQLLPPPPRWCPWNLLWQRQRLLRRPRLCVFFIGWHSPGPRPKSRPLGGERCRLSFRRPSSPPQVAPRRPSGQSKSLAGAAVTPSWLSTSCHNTLRPLCPSSQSQGERPRRWNTI